MHWRLRVEFQVVGTFGNSFVSPGNILNSNPYILHPRHSLINHPNSTSWAFHPPAPSRFHPTPRGQTRIIFPVDCYNRFLTHSPSLILYLLFYSLIYCYNHLSKIQIKSHHSLHENSSMVFQSLLHKIWHHGTPQVFHCLAFIHIFGPLFWSSTMIVDTAPSC